MAKFVHRPKKADVSPRSEPHVCAHKNCDEYAVDKAVDYHEQNPGEFVEVARKYWCGKHRKPGTITDLKGNVDPSDFESVSDTDDYTDPPKDSD